MGQTPSKDQQFSEVYSSYIQQQQNLIYQQQQQINDLFTNNLEQQQQMPSNMFFQSDVHEQPGQQQPGQQQLPSGRRKIDPYKILNLSKNYDIGSLKKAYLKAAMKSHPDRGGSPQAFQQVSIAYTLLTNKLKEKENNHDHNDLRGGSQQYVREQTSQPKVNVNMTEKFDADVFNQIYEDNKIPEVYDEGYGSWMNSSSTLESEQSKKMAGGKMFQNGFNKDMFNSTFDNYKKEQTQQAPHNQLQVRDPEVRISMRNQDSLMTLGQGKITNFGGQTDNLSYTDYKQAFTDGSTLIDVSTVDLSTRSNSIGGIKSQRSNISYNMTAKDQQDQARVQALEREQETNRVARLNVYDQRQAESYEKIHSMLLR